jgi:3-hydroxyisobutyrate dehydrogenase
MRVSIIGIGAMGQDIARHVKHKGHDVSGYDVDAQRRQQAADMGIVVADTAAEAVRDAEVHLVIVATDAQSRSVTQEILAEGKPGSVIVIVATNSPRAMQELSAEAEAAGFGFVDAPVCFGREGAREGQLVSLCGGSEQAVQMASPVLQAYSRAIHHIGPVGSGQLGKTCNNMLHWAACVANYEVLLLAKRYGIDAQRMRETLLDCPGHNVTLKRWDSTRFTWQEKDMDVAMDLAQTGKLALPLFGQIDQLVKHLDAEKVSDLLYGPQADYLGQTIKPLKREEGGVT